MKSALNLLILTFITMLTGCQVYNSSSGDEMAFSGGATAILQTKCSQCHNYAYMTPDQLVSAGLLVKGSAAQSELYLRIKGSGDPSADMPLTGASAGDVSYGDLMTIKAWIDAL